MVRRRISVEDGTRALEVALALLRKKTETNDMCHDQPQPSTVARHHARDATADTKQVRAFSSNKEFRTAVRYSLEELEQRYPGHAVEVRIPPAGAVQILEGTTHRRGTPPAVIETDMMTWLRLVIGDVTWDDAVSAGIVQASGNRADLSEILPLLPM